MIDFKTLFLNKTQNDRDNLNDICNYIKTGKSKIGILQKNPSLGIDDSFQVVACDGNKVIGSGFHFPTRLMINNDVVKSLSCSTLSVSEEYRKRGIGSSIHGARMLHSESGSIFIGSMSRMQYSIMQRLNATVFFSARMLRLRHSVQALRLFLPHRIAFVISLFIDFFLLLHVMILRLFAKIMGYSKYTFSRIKKADDAYNKIFDTDKHRYKECHDKRWMNWMLESNPDVSLYYIKKHDNIVGFVVLKDTYYETATRGLKNVRIRSIVEWESVDDSLTDLKICLFTSLLKGDYDVIEICNYNTASVRKLKGLGFIQVGQGNSVLRLSDDSPLLKYDGIKEASNWRLRPAAGDNILF